MKVHYIFTRKEKELTYRDYVPSPRNEVIKIDPTKSDLYFKRVQNVIDLHNFEYLLGTGLGVFFDTTNKLLFVPEPQHKWYGRYDGYQIRNISFLKEYLTYLFDQDISNLFKVIILFFHPNITAESEREKILFTEMFEHKDIVQQVVKKSRQGAFCQVTNSNLNYRKSNSGLQKFIL